MPSSNVPPDSITITEISSLLPAKEKDTQPFPSQSEDSSSAFNGLIWIALAAICFSFMTTAVRLSSTRFDFPTSAAVLLPSIVHLVLSTFVLQSIIHISPLDLTPRNCCLLAVRGLFGTFAMVLVFKSLSFLPTGEVTAIFSFTPILTMFFSRMTLNEATSIWDVVCAPTGVVGIWLIAEPGTGDHQYIAGTVLLLMAACFAALGFICVRGMGDQVHFMLSVFALGAIGLPVTVILGGKEAFYHILFNPKGTSVVLLGSLAAFFAQSCLNKGLQMCRAGQGVIMKNLEVPSAYALGILVLDEKPTLKRFLGSVAVVSAVILVSVRRLRAPGPS